MTRASYRRVVLDLGSAVTLPAYPFTATPCQRAWLTHRPTARRQRCQRIQDQAHEVRRAGGDVTAYIVGELERLSYPDGTPAERDWARRVLSKHRRG